MRRGDEKTLEDKERIKRKAEKGSVKIGAVFVVFIMENRRLGSNDPCGGGVGESGPHLGCVNLVHQVVGFFA